MTAIRITAGAARRAAAIFSARFTRSDVGAIAGCQRTTSAITATFAAMVMSAGITAAMNTSKM